MALKQYKLTKTSFINGRLESAGSIVSWDEETQGEVGDNFADVDSEVLLEDERPIYAPAAEGEPSVGGKSKKAKSEV